MRNSAKAIWTSILALLSLVGKWWAVGRRKRAQRAAGAALENPGARQAVKWQQAEIEDLEKSMEKNIKQAQPITKKND